MSSFVSMSRTEYHFTVANQTLSRQIVTRIEFVPQIPNAESEAVRNRKVRVDCISIHGSWSVSIGYLAVYVDLLWQL